MIVAGTAHRPKKLTTNASAMYSNALVNALADFFQPFLFEIKPDRVITGGALGGDTGLAVAAIKLNIPLTLAVPFAGQEKKWGKASQDLYYRIMDKARDVIFVEPGGYAAWKMQARNEWMVDQCDLLLALWDGSSGGTANCIQYADGKKKPTYNLWEQWVAYKTPFKL